MFFIVFFRATGFCFRASKNLKNKKTGCPNNNIWNLYSAKSILIKCSGHLQKNDWKRDMIEYKHTQILLNYKDHKDKDKQPNR